MSVIQCPGLAEDGEPMNPLFKFLLTYVLPGVLLCIGLWWWLHTHDAKVTQACNDSHALAVTKAQNEAQEKIKQLEAQYNAQMQELSAKPDSGYGVGPFTSSVLDGLR